ncbi:MAG: caspase family protein [Candidatus Obscuribacter sp.]|nr:caspase family protein [Candidatus Obscuribacter sp.]
MSLRIILSLCLALSCLCPVVQAQEEAATGPVADKWAVVIGISKFKNPTLNLKYSAKDARDFRDFLVNSCHFAPDHVLLLTDEAATKEQILDVLGDSWLPRVTLPEDLCVIYFSSHGSSSDMDLRGTNYVVVHDTNPEKLFTTGISIQGLATTIKERVHSKRVLIVLDACHSGGASDESKGLRRVGGVDASLMAQGTGHAVICSSQKSESSWESKQYANGVFTRSLIESFAVNGEKTTLKEAFGHLKESVQRQVVGERGVTQTPVLEASKWSGPELVLAVPPVRPRPLPEAAKIVLNQPEKNVVSANLNSAAAASNISSSPVALKASVPDIAGDYMGSNGLHYHYWQKGNRCGFEMPAWGETSKGIITENESKNGFVLVSSWSGLVNGSGTADLECDSALRVIKIKSQDGTVLTRVDVAK